MKINVKTLLKAAFDYLHNVVLWQEYSCPSWTSNSTAHFHKAEAIINYIEEFDCGSHGGFGKNQPENQNLFKRWEWLNTKYVGTTTQYPDFNYIKKKLKK